jgi:diguanylate cyclase (GGDEF)-like protein
MRHPDWLTDGGLEPETTGRQALDQLSRLWLHAAAESTFIPGPRASARAGLEALLHRLARALKAEPFDPGSGYRVGAALVAARMSSPHVLGKTLTLLGHRLLPAIDSADDPVAAERLAELLGQLATGFTTALREVAVGAAEEISRAERAAWRNQQFALQRQLQHALLHDPLSGLPNRATLLDRLRTEINDAAPLERLAVCLLKVHRLDVVNDTLGHDKGDRLLCQIAQRLRPVATRRGYPLAHVGGDEFALVVPGTTGPEHAVKAVDEVLRVLPDPYVLDGYHLAVGVRAGIVEQLAATADPIELLRCAHIAAGWADDDRRPYAVFEPDRSRADIRRHHLAAAMPGALKAGEFFLDYQPLVRLADRAVVGVEALARWRHPGLGVVAPGQFIALAEQTGFIQSLGQHLLERACGEALDWRGLAGPLTVSVNLAPAQLERTGLVAAIASVLDRSGLPPGQLQLEITESAALDAHHRILHELAGLGIRLAIDDFGTGYSSLAHLAELPVRTVKLAARFLHAVPDGPGRATPHGPGRATPPTLLPNVIDMCHDLGISVTAEGVETAAQAHRLTTLGCDTGQGFHLGKPTTPAGLVGLLGVGVPGSADGGPGQPVGR